MAQLLSKIIEGSLKHHKYSTSQIRTKRNDFKDILFKVYPTNLGHATFLQSYLVKCLEKENVLEPCDVLRLEIGHVVPLTYFCYCYGT